MRGETLCYNTWSQFNVELCHNLTWNRYPGHDLTVIITQGHNSMSNINS